MIKPHLYKTIEGFFDFQRLYDEMVDKAEDGDIMVELGSWLGMSSCYLAEKIRLSGKRIGLYCIDTWTGYVQGSHEGISIQCMQFCKNMQDRGLDLGLINEIFYSDIYDYDIVMCPYDSTKSADFFFNNEIQFVFLDDDHSYDKVKENIKTWMPKIKNGGYMGGHDLKDRNVFKAVRDSFNLEDVFRFKSTVDSNTHASWLYQKGRYDNDN